MYTRFAVNWSHLNHCALEMATDHASDEGIAGGYFEFTPTSGPDQSL